MVNSRNSLTVIVCLICVFQINPALLRRLSHFKRFGQVPGTLESNDIQSSSLFFKGKGFQPETTGARHGSIVLECEAGGSPPPTIHWLKNGIRISQGSSKNIIREDETSYEDRTNTGSNMLRLSSTRSRLFLDCLGKASQGQYSCVAENALIRKSRTTFLKVENSIMYPDLKKCVGKKYKKGEPARIYMWTVSRLEYINNMVQLFCRAQGFPKPTITWYRENKPIENDDDYQITDNGDLIIKDITWERHRFSYYCVASNVYGTDAAEAFLYPTLQEDFGLPYE
ncbi:unnamed protein product [Candidula unifasciata]|uniref:Ig-like domain-containing protein n=1 Tax=Candidula unifasciata TaxID=100452 RepID=A0A8S4A3K5_9EUPU|nr:unnamed protein product [Candidula unifasciata]